MRIALSGSHGTGKSTLLAALDTDLTKVPSCTREILAIAKRNWLDPDDIQKYVLMREAVQLQDDNIIMDRCLLDGLAYTYYLNETKNTTFVTSSCWLAKKLEPELTKLTHVVLFEPFKQVKDDGVRWTDEKSAQYIDAWIYNKVVELNIPYTVLGRYTSVVERVRQLKEIINEYR